MTGAPGLGGALRRRWKLTAFVVGTAAGAVALLAAGRAVLAGAPEEEHPALVAAYGILYGMPPLLLALALEGAIAQGPVVTRFGVRFRPNRGFALALVAPLGLVAAALALAAVQPDARLAWTADAFAARRRELGLEGAGGALGDAPLLALVGRALAPGSLLFQTLLWFPGEVAFRGLVHRELGGGVFRAGLVGGALWGLWLVPLYAVGAGFADAPAATAAVTVATGVALGPWLAFVRERSGSVVATAVFLGALTRLAAVPTNAVLGGTRWVVGYPGVAVAAAAVLGWLVLRAAERVWPTAAAGAAPHPAR